MPSWNALSDEKKKAILLAYDAGEKTDSIAAQFNISRSAPRTLASRHGRPPRIQWPKCEQS